jgi:type VI secretion system protein ImpA
VPVSRVISDAILSPVSPDKPAGEDLSATSDWVTIRKARPTVDDSASKGVWEPVETVKTDWPHYKNVVEDALCTKSKDLRLAVFLADACTRLHGFAGVRDGFWAVRELISGFAEKGLFPQAEGGDMELQYGPLSSLNEGLAEAIREVPITFRPAPAVNYSLNYRDESLRKDGLIKPGEFESAVAAGSVDRYQQLASELADAQSELKELEQVTSARYGEDALSFTSAKQALEDCAAAVASMIRKKQGSAAAAGTSAQPASVGVGSGVAAAIARAPIPTTAAIPKAAPDVAIGSDAWAVAEQLARSGNIDMALATMTALAAAEANGRVRFQRKLLLAELCMQTSRHRLAKSILEELNELIEAHKLASWETSELVGAVWTRLYKCYRNEAAGIANADKANEILLKLSRLDPWQAISCADVK